MLFDNESIATDTFATVANCVFADLQYRVPLCGNHNGVIDFYNNIISEPLYGGGWAPYGTPSPRVNMRSNLFIKKTKHPFGNNARLYFISGGDDSLVDDKSIYVHGNQGINGWTFSDQWDIFNQGPSVTSPDKRKDEPWASPDTPRTITADINDPVLQDILDNCGMNAPRDAWDADVLDRVESFQGNYDPLPGCGVPDP